MWNLLLSIHTAIQIVNILVIYVKKILYLCDIFRFELHMLRAKLSLSS